MLKKTKKFSITVLFLLGFLSITAILPLFDNMAGATLRIGSTPKTAAISESWGSVRLVSAGSVNDSQNPALASDGLNNTFLTWDECNETTSQDDYDINLRVFMGSTDSWENTQIISRDLNDQSKNPDIAVDSNNNATIVWQDASDNDTSYYSPTIFYSRQKSDGTWTRPQNITHTNSSEQINPSICYVGTNAHLVWNQQNRTDSNNHHINYSKNFLAGEKIGSDVGSNSNPQIISDTEGTLQIVGDYYSDSNIFHISYDGSWSTITEKGSTGANSKDPQVALDSQSNLHIIWDDSYFIGGTHDLEATYLNKSAETWESFNTGVTQEDPDLSADIAIDNDDNIHIVWVNTPSGGDKDIFYKRYNADEESWTDAQLVSEGSTQPSESPLINIDSSGIINIIWIDHTDDYVSSGSDKDLFLRRLTLSEVPSGGGSTDKIPGYNPYFLIAVLGIASVLLFKKFKK